MIELTLGELRNPMFNEALQKIVKSTELDFKTSYNVARLVKKIVSEQTLALDVYGALLKKYGTSTDGGENFSIPEEKRPEFAKEAAEYVNTKVTIDRNKINVSELTKLSKTEL
jgi:hypothetical protein